MSAFPPGRVDLLDIRMIDCELQDEAIWIGQVERSAISMIGHHRHLVSGILRPGTDGVLLLTGDQHREVPEEGEGSWRCELIGELAVRELEEGEAPAVSELVHGVTELLLVPAHQVLDFGPRGDEGHADDFLVELAGGLLIVGDVGVVVEARRRCVRGSVVCVGMGRVSSSMTNLRQVKSLTRV